MGTTVLKEYSSLLLFVFRATLLLLLLLCIVSKRCEGVICAISSNRRAFIRRSVDFSIFLDGGDDIIGGLPLLSSVSSCVSCKVEAVAVATYVDCLEEDAGGRRGDFVSVLSLPSLSMPSRK